MRRLAGEADHVALDAERAEHDAESAVLHRLEHRSLLDVQLEIGARVDPLQLGVRVEHAIERDAVLAPARPAARSPARSFSSRTSSVSIAPAAAADPSRLRPKRAPSSSAQSTSRSVTGGVPSRRCRPQHLRAGQHAEAAVEPAAVRHRVEVAADARARGRRARQRDPVVAGLVDLLVDTDAVELTAQERRAPSPRFRSRRLAGRRSRRPSAPATRRGRARSGSDRAPRWRS